MRFFLFSLLLSISGASVLAEPVSGQSQPPAGPLKVPAKAVDFLETYCYDCHGDGSEKGNFQLDGLETLPLAKRLQVLNQIQEQVFSGEMPPREEFQPLQGERESLLKWVSGELQKSNASTLEDKLRYYRYGNYFNHDKLFNGSVTEVPFTRARRWRINELIYLEKINDIFELSGRARQESFYGVVKPFNLPTESGVKYYDTEAVEGGQFLTLMSNAKWVAAKQLKAALLKAGKYQYPDGYAELKKENPRRVRSTFPDELWHPDTTPAPFEVFVTADQRPSDAQLQAAITKQFQLALQRAPTPAEMEKYLGFMTKTLEVADPVIALKKMLVSVLMEPEFLYRSEFGGGSPDGYGRRRLTPREASYALAYALTDRVPDPGLVEAAASGRLRSKADYRREVERMLDDDSLAKPRILRFFQDYFGYYGIYDVFKDEERFIGNYNPHRVVSTKYIYRIPGKVSQEADTLVQWILDRDEEVLKTLLTTDRFFVQHSGDNEEMIEEAKKAREVERKNREIYLALKDYRGKERAKVAKSMGLYHNANGQTKRSLGYDMVTFAELFGEDGNAREGLQALPKDRLEHSLKMYNLDYRTWSYEPAQPISLPHRSGLLTHPAWLVSTSQNAHTDPVVRGKWIREKLLGGFIPDVPINVDAKVPENHHETLRERFAVTEAKQCWHCHEKMNPLGYVLESYDDFGRFRLHEKLEAPENIIETRRQKERGVHGPYTDYEVPIYQSKPVDPTGSLVGTGNPDLDGPVRDTRELMERLAQSERVRQVFIRNVFRYFMGRNETFADSHTLIEADRAYLEDGGSFRALVISLLSSDSFIYRK